MRGFQAAANIFGMEVGFVASAGGAPKAGLVPLFTAPPGWLEP